MEQFDLTQNVDNLFHSFENFTQKEGVIGKAVTQGDKTFMPIVSVTIGYGGGNTAMKSQPTTPAAGSSAGGALGLGAKLNTEAVIVIDNENISMLPMSASGASQLMDKIPQIVSSMSGKSQGQQQGQQQTSAQG